MASDNRSEEIIGKALKKYKIPREELVITTKCFFGNKTTGTQRRASRTDCTRRHILTAVAESIKRLGTYIDILQIHRLDHSISAEEIVDVLHEVIENSDVLHLGASTVRVTYFLVIDLIKAPDANIQIPRAAACRPDPW